MYGHAQSGTGATGASQHAIADGAWGRTDGDFEMVPHAHISGQSADGAGYLSRSGTLAPEDSVSRYRWRADDPSSDELQYASQGPDADRRHGDRYLQPALAETPDEYDDQYYGNHGDTSYTQLAAPLRGKAADMGHAEDEEDEMRRWDIEQKGTPMDGPVPLFSNDLNGSNTVQGEVKGTGLLRGQKSARTIDDAVRKRQQGIGRQRWAPVTWVFAAVYLAVFVAELVKSASETGAAIQTKPNFNPMIGPSGSFLIHFGARFVPCMRPVPQIPAATATLPCLDAVNNDSDYYQSAQLCTLAELCGLSNPSQPNQTWRLVSAMFLHAGILHILFNLMAQLTICAQMERILGSLAYTPVYIAGGIGGNLLGSNFGLIGTPSVGASGAIFAIIAMEIVDLLYNWRYEPRKKLRLFLSVGLAILSFGIGLLPGLDNFAHIGGFAVGVLGGMIVGPSIHPTRTHRLFIWALRVVGLVLLTAFMVGLGINFARSDDPTQACTWCKYLSCLRVFSQCKGVGGSFGSTTGNG